MNLDMLPPETFGLQEEAHTRAREEREFIQLRMPEALLNPVQEALVKWHVLCLRDLGRLDSFDWALRLLVSRLFPWKSGPGWWGDVEGVTAHMSGRGCCELHVWTTKQSGRELEIKIGQFYATKLPSAFDVWEERCRTHGHDGFSLLVNVKYGSAPVEFVIAALAATEPGPIEQLSTAHEPEQT